MSDCPFRYQGQYEDAETGLYFNRFRYYDPEVGSYVSQDPIQLDGENPTFYGYVNNPTLWIDPLALDPIQKSIDRHKKKQAKRESTTKKHQYENPGHHDKRGIPGKNPYIKGKDTLPSDAHEVFKDAVKIDDRNAEALPLL